MSKLTLDQNIWTVRREGVLKLSNEIVNTLERFNLEPQGSNTRNDTGDIKLNRNVGVESYQNSELK